MGATAVIDFESSETHLLLNPRLPQDQAIRLRRLSETNPLPAHVWIATSGTTGLLKLVALSKSALLSSATSVNSRLSATSRDVWCCVLPTFHVGGLGIYARAHLSQSRVIAMPWDPMAFGAACVREKVTLASLVPAQVADLVDREIEAAACLRSVIVGGGRLAESMRTDALRLGWPLLPSYGMTETASQVATALSPSSAELRLLPHVEAAVDDGRLAFRGSSLLTGYAVERAGTAEWFDPRVGGWLVTEDRGSIRDGVLTVEGRGGDFAKVGGESVDLMRLSALLETLSRRSAIVAIEDRRLGQALHLVSEENNPQELARRFNELVAPFERVRGSHQIEQLPRTELGKLIRRTLAEFVEQRMAGPEEGDGLGSSGAVPERK